ncbi:3-ketoacyl-CoA thiolase, mitochondrial isoform X1 [Octopus sinensis]|uniref:3-ketoacyl-CoA thiolase, mitochondrial isoform X1 n=1 Tax=Octopus sinensis TaxID=2607531 RepID=A0A6P7SVV0_9MOLL|nr:3-ketoacyl-CoA thiolase, mitochondrial isoform X1 [Octopus sinensis]
MVIARTVKDVFIIAAKRTAFGTFGGKLKMKTPTDLAEAAAKAALASANVTPEMINSVIIGNVIQSAADSIYIARHVGLRIGVPIPVPSYTVNRLCGSGFQAIVNASQEIMLGDSDIVLCGGADNMSMTPYSVRNARFGTTLGIDLKMEDTLMAGLTDLHVKLPMAITAENLAVKYGLSREEVDEFALRSQTRWRAAQDGGHFKAEIAPLTVKGKKGAETFEVDEHPRPTTKESLAKLPPVFKKNGVVTAGNASGICDGASCLILASENAVKKHNLTPLARVVSYGIAGCDPTIMGIGPAPAARAALKVAGKNMHDMDLIEVNEAFGAQYLAVEKELELDPARTNPNGGAIALGHPLAASGARITGHLVHEIKRTGGKLALGSACIGGGQGIAVITENL